MVSNKIQKEKGVKVNLSIVYVTTDISCVTRLRSFHEKQTKYWISFSVYQLL